jgi:hypothetical protein
MTSADRENSSEDRSISLRSILSVLRLSWDWKTDNPLSEHKREKGLLIGSSAQKTVSDEKSKSGIRIGASVEVGNTVTSTG